jgi:hypothetical protein
MAPTLAALEAGQLSVCELQSGELSLVPVEIAPASASKRDGQEPQAPASRAELKTP